MKELSIKEKAKAYDKAIKVIKENLDALNEITETGANVVNIQSIRNCFYKAFPELKSNIEVGDKVKIHCNSSRADSIKRLCDNKIGTVHHVWDLERNPWGNIVVVVEGGYRDGFLYEELEQLK